MKVRTYNGGTPIDITNLGNQFASVLEVELEDGRTIQMAVWPDGTVNVRGWGNIPITLGNATQVSLTFDLTSVPQLPKDHPSRGGM